MSAQSNKHDSHEYYDCRCSLCVIEYREAGIAARIERPDLYIGWAWGASWPRPKKKPVPVVTS